MNEELPIIPGASNSTNRLWRVVLFVVVCGLFFYFGFVVTTPFNVAYKADVGFKQARRNIDPNPLQAWAVREIAKYPFTNDNENMRTIPQSEIPDPVKTLYRHLPDAAILKNEANGMNYVKIVWGSGFFQWSFWIGPTNFSISTNGTYYQTTKWVDGVYFLREGR